MLARAPGFEEALLVVDIDPADGDRRGACATCAGARSRASAATPPARPIVHVGAPREQTATGRARSCAVQLDDLEQMRLALELGLRDYVEKNGFSEVVIGVSGGIDSALTAALAVEALGAERVHCVSMPSRYSLGGDAQRRAAARREPRHRVRELPIEPIDRGRVRRRRSRRAFAGRERDLTEENLQARDPRRRC